MPSQFPLEQLDLYDDTVIYWNVVPADQTATPTIEFQTKTGKKVTINRLTGEIIS